MADDPNVQYPCPACDAELFGWTAARHPIDLSKIVLDRCEDCGIIVTRAHEPPDVETELGRLQRQGSTLIAPNRKSFQGGIGGAQWAGLEPERRRIHLTPEGARKLLARRGERVGEVRTPYRREGFGVMLQTLTNGFTYRDNFRRNSKAGRLHPETSREKFLFWLDTVVSAIVLIPLAMLAWLLERIGSLAGRGGIMELELETGTGATAPDSPDAGSAVPEPVDRG